VLIEIAKFLRLGTQACLQWQYITGCISGWSLEEVEVDVIVEEVAVRSSWQLKLTLVSWQYSLRSKRFRKVFEKCIERSESLTETLATQAIDNRSIVAERLVD